MAARMSKSLRAKVLRGFAVPIILMIVSAAIRYWAIERTTVSTHWVVHTDEVIAKGSELGAAFTRLEVKAGEHSTLTSETVDEEVRTLVRQQVRLEALVADNPPQLMRLKRFDALFHHWQTSARWDRVDPLISAEIHQLLREFIAVERELLEQRVEANESASTIVKWTDIALPAVAILLVLLTAIVISGEIGRRVRALVETTNALAAGALDRRVVIEDDDELSALATAFNKMADRLAERSRHTELLADLSDGLQACIDVSEAHDLAQKFMLKAAPTSSGGASLYNASRNLLTRAFDWRPDASATTDLVARTLQSEDCLALRRGKAHIVRDATREVACKHLDIDHGSTMCIPLMAHGETVGVLSILDERTDAWSGETAKLFHTMAEQLGLAFANLQLRARLRNQSIRDPLTGLFNRRYLEETFVRELARSARSKHELGVVVLDVDHFKRFNDTYGHDAGDSVLRSVGALLQSSTRESDIPCRFGGEEFVIVFTDIDLEALQRRAERLREAIKAVPITHRGEVVGPVTVSIGLAITPLHGTTPESLIATADKALYAAKAGGRDRVVVGAESTAPTILYSLPPDKPQSGPVPASRRRAT